MYVHTERNKTKKLLKSKWKNCKEKQNKSTITAGGFEFPLSVTEQVDNQQDHGRPTTPSPPEQRVHAEYSPRQTTYWVIQQP